MAKYTVTELQTVLRHGVYTVEAGSASEAYDLVEAGDGGEYETENEDVISAQIEAVDSAE